MSVEKVLKLIKGNKLKFMASMCLYNTPNSSLSAFL
jgi:hypothetical protein